MLPKQQKVVVPLYSCKITSFGIFWIEKMMLAFIQFQLPGISSENRKDVLFLSILRIGVCGAPANELNADKKNNSNERDCCTFLNL